MAILGWAGLLFVAWVGSGVWVGVAITVMVMRMRRHGNGSFNQGFGQVATKKELPFQEDENQEKRRKTKATPFFEPDRSQSLHSWNISYQRIAHRRFSGETLI